MNKFRKAFETVKAHALTMSCKAERDDECRYRTPDGLKCFVGALISDDSYEVGMEGRSVEDLFGSWGPTIDDIDIEMAPFLTALQKIHDMSPPELWQERLAIFESEWEEVLNGPA